MNFEEIINKTAELKAKMLEKNAEIIEQATNGADLADVEALEKEVEDLEKRVEILNRKAQDIKEETKEETPTKQTTGGTLMDAKNILNTYNKRAVTLGDIVNTLKIEEGGSNGQALIPENMDRLAVIEPSDINPLNGLITRSKDSDVIPCFSVEIAGSDLQDILDGESAQEIEAKASGITFKHTQTRIKTKYTDNMLQQTGVEFVRELRAKLAEGLALREVFDFFNESPEANKKERSVYASGVKKVDGVSLFDAVINATDELTAYTNLTLMVNRRQYVELAKEFGGQELAALNPENLKQALGVKEIKVTPFVKGAPIIGDFKYYRKDVKGQPIVETDKNIDNGQFMIVLNENADAVFVLKSAFRVLEVTPS